MQSNVAWVALGWTIGCAIAAIVANAAIVSWTGKNNARRLDRMERDMQALREDRSAIRTTLEAHEKRLDHLEDL